MPAPDKWTLVQHSAMGYKGRADFERGLEVRIIPKTITPEAITNLGGLVFDDYKAAHDRAYQEMYPVGVAGLNPQARGTFHVGVLIDGLRLYLAPKVG